MVGILYLCGEAFAICVAWGFVGCIVSVFEAAPQGKKSGWSGTFLYSVIAVAGICAVGWLLIIFNNYLIQLGKLRKMDGSQSDGVLYLLFEAATVFIFYLIAVCFKYCLYETIERVNKTNAKYDIYDQDAAKAEE